MDWKWIAGIPGALLALIGIWLAFGFPTVATSNDIQKLSRDQAETAVEVYQSKTRNIILNAPSERATAQTQRLYEEELRQARSKLDQAEKRKIELSK